MAESNIKYLKDEEGNIISPITSVKSVYDETGGELSKYICDLIYPVGSIYITIQKINPQTLFGGTWEQKKDRFLLGVGDTYTAADKTGGEATHKLTVAELPSHNHSFTNGKANSGGAHMHSVGSVSTGTKGSNQQRISSVEASTGGFGTTNEGAHTHTVTGTIGNTGSGTAHNNMPPYLTVYMWERIA